MKDEDLSEIACLLLLAIAFLLMLFTACASIELPREPDWKSLTETQLQNNLWTK
jgi:hypothetical protein